MLKLTEEYINSLIVKEESHKIGEKTTIVLLILKNGFEIIGSSACVDPKAYSHEIGTLCARERAVHKIWELEGYAAQNLLASSIKND